MLLTSTEARWLIRDRERGSSSSARPDPQKSEETVDHRRYNNYVKAVGASPVHSSGAVRVEVDVKIY